MANSTVNNSNNSSSSSNGSTNNNVTTKSRQSTRSTSLDEEQTSSSPSQPSTWRSQHSRTSSDSTYRSEQRKSPESSAGRRSGEQEEGRGSKDSGARRQRNICREDTSLSGIYGGSAGGKGRRGQSSDGGQARSRQKPTTASSSPERSEKGRQTSSTSWRTRDDIEYENRTLSMSKAEPKFEPRFSYYKSNPVEAIKRDSAHYSVHRKKIWDAKPLVDNKPPPMFSHIHSNMKKLKKTQDRQDEIERANKLLLERLVKAMTTTRVDNWNDLENRIVPSSRAKQRQQIVETAAENRQILNRIDSRKSTVSYSRERRREGTQSNYQRRVELHRSAQQQQQQMRGGSGSDSASSSHNEERHSRSSGKISQQSQVK